MKKKSIKKTPKVIFGRRSLFLATKKIHKKRVGGKSLFAGNAGFSISGSKSLTHPLNKEVIFHKMVFENLNLGPSASNSGCGSTAKKATVSWLRFAIAFPSREYDPENMLFGAIHCELEILRIMTAGIETGRWSSLAVPIRQPAG